MNNTTYKVIPLEKEKPAFSGQYFCIDINGKKMIQYFNHHTGKFDTNFTVEFWLKEENELDNTF